MYVDELVLRDFRAIAWSRVSLTHPLAEDAGRLDASNLNLVVGTNGSGKSTVLKAIAATATLMRGGELPDSAAGWPRIGGPGDAEVQLRMSGRDDAGTRLTANRLVIAADGSVATQSQEGDAEGLGDGVVAAYGPQRVGGAAGAASDDTRPHLLFDDTELMPLADWLPDSPRRGGVAATLNALLPDDVRCLDTPTREGHVFTQRGLPLPLAALSDGVQSFVAWVGDLLRRLDLAADDRNVDLAEVDGVVLVDEVDQRLHPRWQRSLLTRLGSTFPSLQFVCTAHSPLFLSGLRRQNLLLVEPDPERREEGATVVRRLAVEDVYGCTADQVLQSSYFEMDSSRSEPFWENLRALARDAQTGSGGRAAALEFMHQLARPAEPSDRDGAT